jgi:hypothetical protein
MQFSINSPTLQAVVVSEAERDLDYDTKAEKFTPEGVPLFVVSLVIMDKGRENILIRVRVAGDPDLRQGQMVKVIGFAVNVLNKNGAMVWWTVEGLEPIEVPAAAEAKAARAGSKAAGE